MAEIPPVVDLGGIVEAEAADTGLYESTYFLSSTSDFAGYYDEVDAADPFALSDEQIAFLAHAANLVDAAKGGIDVGDKRLEVLHVFRCGLLESRGRPYQKDSPDFVAIIKVDGAIRVAAMEMKCRCANATASKERARISAQGKFSYASCRSPDLRRYLQSRSEALQCLHHAATLGVDYVVFVTGDTIGLTSGVLIEYDEQIRSSYNKCIDDIYEEALKWAYDSSVPVPEEEIKAAVGKARVKIDYHSFMKSVYVWKEMTKPENLPLPPAIRIIPMQCQYWNYSKHGSDQKTQAAEGHRAVLPFDSRQSKVIDRMLMLILSDIHSLAKLTTAKKDLSFYSSLQGYREAGSQRYSLEKVLIEARLALLAMIKDEEGGVIEEDAAAIAALVSDDDEASPDSPQVTKVDVLKYCGTTPKRDVKRRYDDPRDVNDEAVIRFKACRGIPIYRVAVDLKHRGPGARGSRMLCKADTNWWCAGCHTWVCHGGGSGSDESANGDSPRARSFIRDVKECIARVAGRTKKRRVVVTAAHSCFVRSHPNFLECVPCASEEDADSP